jgi:hypothetical protein
MSAAALEDANAVFWALTSAALIANAAAVALPARSIASLVVGFGAALLTFVIADLIGSFLYLVPAVVVAVLAAREWSYRWCLVSLPAVAAAYFLFEVLRPLHWPFLLLTLCAYAIPVVHRIRRPRARPL